MPSSNNLQLIELTDLNFPLIHSLLEESKKEGYHLVQRTIDDWSSGANKFSRIGERLWGLILGTELIGIGGLNRDPYIEDTTVGRVRHLYIREAHRRKGYATLLMNTIIDEAQQHFIVLRLFTDNPAAAQFYETLGFQKTKGHKVTHALNFQNMLAETQDFASLLK